MQGKYIKITIFFSLIFCLFFLCNNFCYALEIQYPSINGSNINSNTNFPDYVKYLFDLGMFLGFFSAFISLLIAGSLYFLSPAIPDALSMAKDRVTGAISGILILALVYLITITIYPQLSVFTLNDLEKVNSGNEKPVKNPGVYLSNYSYCPDNTNPNTSSVPDLGSLKEGIVSAHIVQGDNENDLYISTLFGSFNYYGECEYIEPNTDCQKVTPFANSVSIHKYETNPNGDGVRFYRKPFFNEEGGYYEVSNSDIKGIYMRDLNKLTFDNGGGFFDGLLGEDSCSVPEEEQDCIQYNINGFCVKRSCPTLANGNISSIEIKGDYVVLLVYYNPEDHLSKKNVTRTHWNFCQEFPAPNDANKSGPQEIKWRNITNHNKNVPNWVVIFPVKKN